MCFQFVGFPNLTFVDFDPKAIISSLHQPIRRRKMNNNELLIEAMSRLKFEAARTECAVGLMVTSRLTVLLY